MFALLSIAFGCTHKKSTEGGDKEPAVAFNPVSYRPYLNNPFISQGSALLPPPLLELSQFEGALLWALTRCQCAPRTAAKYLGQVAVARGALPQTLVPAIRAEIRGNSDLMALMALPAGLSDLLASFFADDESIASKIRDGLASKLARFAPGGSSLAGAMPFRFDLFPDPSAAAQPTSFSLTQAAERWNVALALPALWNGTAPPLGDHGLQLLETMRVLSEWKYLLGLDQSPDGLPYGGLSLDPASGALAGVFDPRLMPDVARYFSGSYAVTFPVDSAVNMALNVKERWTHNTGPVSLREQSTIWHAAALAFGRLRPEQRQATAGLFGTPESALFPLDTHALPLAFLPGLQALLDGPFVVKEQRLILREAALGGGGGEPAPLSDLVRYLAALGLWVHELGTVETAQLPAATADKLKAAPDKLKPAIQLGVQTILGRIVSDAGDNQVLTDNTSPDGLASAALTAEVIATLSEICVGILPSPYLGAKVSALGHWLVASRLAPLWETKTSGLTANELLWSLAALRALERVPEAQDAPWLKPGVVALSQAVADWDRAGEVP